MVLLFISVRLLIDDFIFVSADVHRFQSSLFVIFTLFTMQTSWQGLGSCGRIDVEIESDIVQSASISCVGRSSCQYAEIDIIDTDMESAVTFDMACSGYRLVTCFHAFLPSPFATLHITKMQFDDSLSELSGQHFKARYCGQFGISV